MNNYLATLICALCILLIGLHGEKSLIAVLTDLKKADLHTPVFSSGYYLPAHITGKFTIGPKLGVIIISGLSTVEKNAQLIIEPGTTLAVNEYGGVIVRGSVKADGTLTQPIHFISNEIREENRTWNGILFDKGSNGIIYSTIFHHASPGVSCAKETNVSVSHASFKFGNVEVFGPCSYNH